MAKPSIPPTHAPLPTIRRMPSYLRVLQQLMGTGQENVSATQVAGKLNLDAIQVRKDLALTGVVGKPKVGFPVAELVDAIETFLGWDNTMDAFLVGAGSLGRALIGYEGFREHGLNIVAAFDIDENKVGHPIHGREVLPMSKLADLSRRMHIRLGILAVPAQAAQSAADLMVQGGIEAIWNFTPTKLQLPAEVMIERVDLAAGLAVLSRRLRDRHDTPAKSETSSTDA